MTAVEVRAPSRLHFGLLSFGHDDRGQFGGAGVMIAKPQLRLSIRAGKGLVVTGPRANRAKRIARHAAEFLKIAEPLDFHIEIHEAARPHVGLGSGTQLGLSIAAGLAHFFELPALSPIELAAAAGRGQRSSIGTYGFLHGGWLYDEIRQPDQCLAPLQERIAVPDEWRWLLVRPRGSGGISGWRENAAFADLPAVPAATTARLRREIREYMSPALRRRDLKDFGESIYRYGLAAGECFAAAQGGPFASPFAARLVDRIRAMGISGVGQSSWGPTIFALIENESVASDIRANLLNEFDAKQVRIRVTASGNSGARCETLPS